MPSGASFDCLWCGRSFEPRDPSDIEAWARLCPDCVGRAQSNPFLRARLRAGLEARAAAAAQPAPPVRAAAEGAAELAEPSAPAVSASAVSPPPAPPPAVSAPAVPVSDLDAEMVRYYAARAGEYDDWYLRRGRYSHGPVHDVAWQSDLDAAGRWLDSLPWHGEIVELAAGTGWWSPLLAAKGTLSLYDAAPEPLERARARLVAHGLRAHLHVRDAWAAPDRQVDGLFAGFWLSHVARERLGEFLSLAASWLSPGGLFAFIDSRPDAASGAEDHVPPVEEAQVRRLENGSEFLVRKVYYEPSELEKALRAAGFAEASVTTTSRFFLLGVARR